MRVISGQFKGRRLRAPEGKETRPVTDRVKEAVFSHLGPAAFEGSRVADLFAGAGSFGIEALSRGADHCVFVEAASKPLRHLERNIRPLVSGSKFQIVPTKVDRFLENNTERFDMVFCDPPWSLQLEPLTKVLTKLSHHLQPEAQVIVSRRYGDPIPFQTHSTQTSETEANHPPSVATPNRPQSSLSTPLEIADLKRYGDTVIICYRLAESLPNHRL